MKNLIYLLTLLSISCNAQTISLEDEAQCSTNPNCPDYTYAKDINNSLNKYVGTWKGSHNGKNYELKISLGLYEDMGFKRDKLIGRLLVKDSNGNTIYNTMNNFDNETKFNGLGFQPDLKAYIMDFMGNYYICGDYGAVYLRIKPDTPNKMSILMLPDQDIMEDSKCPLDFQPVIPYKTTFYLLKQ